MTTTPAMPELTPLTGDILIQDRTIYVLNKNGENAWWATVYPGFHDNGIRVSEDQCRAVAADLARLATLQAQPAAAGVSDDASPPDALAMCMQRAVEGFSEFLVGKCTGEPPRLSMAFVISLFEAILKETDKSKQIVAVAPDAVLDEIIEHAEQAVGMSHTGWDNVNPRELVRAILALRPQAVPMTEDTARLDWIAAQFGDVLLLEMAKDLPRDEMPLREAIDHLRGITVPAGGGA